MLIEQIYTGCLAQGAYFIESQGEAAIIDPLREITPYIKKAEKNGAQIKYIFETHFHADFVSGHLSLSNRTKAPIVFGPTAETHFESIIAKDGQHFALGELTIVALHTPGHTIESTTYLLKDKKGKDHAIFSGDTMFLGDVGRPDLAQKGAEMTQEQLAGMLYKSLRTKIMPLADDVIVYPAHGAGSACGKNLSKETVGTLGEQKKINYALRENMTKAEFIKEVTEGLLPPPEYFPLNVKMNKEGYEDFEAVIKRSQKEYSVEELEEIANRSDAIILDVRSQDEFAKGHIPQSIFIGLDGGFAPWAGAVIANVDQPLLLVTPQGREREAITRLSRVGFDHTLGSLKGGFDTWKNSGKETDQVKSITAEEFKNSISEKTEIFDIRKPDEFSSERIPQALSTPLDFINEHLNKFPKQKEFYIYCAGGYRSMIAASILKRRGIHNLLNVELGFKAIKETGIKTTDFICPSTL